MQKPRRSVREGATGFTLLEIAIALGIIVVLFVTMIPVVELTGAERRLCEAVGDVSEFARDMRALAARESRRVEVLMEPDGLFERMPDGSRGTGIGFPRDVRVSVPGPRARWVPLDGQVWQFSPIGTVSPVTLRFSTGDKWIEVDFDFLTGRVAEERYAL